MWTRTAVAAAVIERLPGASGLPQHVVDLRAHSAFFEMTAYHDGDALGPSPAWGLKTLVTAAVLFLSLGFWLGQYYVRRLLPSRAEPAPPSQPGAGPQRTQGPVGAEPAPAPRPETRSMSTQSQTTYARHYTQPRFKPLPDAAQGAWVCQMPEARSEVAEAR